MTVVDLIMQEAFKRDVKCSYPLFLPLTQTLPTLYGMCGLSSHSTTCHQCWADQTWFYRSFEFRKRKWSRTLLVYRHWILSPKLWWSMAFSYYRRLAVFYCRHTSFGSFSPPTSYVLHHDFVAVVYLGKLQLNIGSTNSSLLVCIGRNWQIFSSCIEINNFKKKRLCRLICNTGLYRLYSISLSARSTSLALSWKRSSVTGCVESKPI